MMSVSKKKTLVQFIDTDIVLFSESILQGAFYRTFFCRTGSIKLLLFIEEYKRKRNILVYIYIYIWGFLETRIDHK